MTPGRSPGRIVTFYSYKGGTGRSMALANVAWILASNGCKVLAIDWDLEAPGLHRYFHPFLEDGELEASPGLIDFFTDFAMAARVATLEQKEGRWWQSWTALDRYTYSLEWPFPGEGTLDLVPAGQQGPAYADRVAGFEWRAFYDKLGGGLLLEALKGVLRSRYDYVLIDSRTGVSDTSGICTVQMPDDLVACFTLNQQGMKGTAAVADSAWAQRLKPTGEPGLRVWPVPMRIELAEKERLDAARDDARLTFGRFIQHMSRDARADYWERVQVLYQPFFAYEEVLAPFAERRRQTGSILGAMETLASAIAGRATALVDMTEHQRQDGFRRFTRTVDSRATTRSTSQRSFPVFMSYGVRSRDRAERLATDLLDRGFDVFWDGRLVPGEDVAAALKEGLARAAAVLVLIGDELGMNQSMEVAQATATGKRIIPVLIGKVGFEMLPGALARYHAADLRGDSYERGLSAILQALDRAAEVASTSIPYVPEDPQKGRWGGRAADNGRRIDARVSEINDGWFRIELRVETTDARPLAGDVEFHLHPSFRPSVVRVPVRDGNAILEVQAWGAFTVGAIADEGRTTLELDLSADSSYPRSFRDR